MAWNYYTAPLAAGEELTSAMWYELCEALAERFAVTGQTTQVDLTTAAAIAASGAIPRGVPISTSGGAAVLTAWTTILSGTQSNWAANTTTTDTLTVSSGSSFTTSTEWGAEGLSSGDWTTLVSAVSAGWHDRRYWNVIRATIQRLQTVYVALSAASIVLKAKFVNPTTGDLAVAKAAYVSSGEFTSVPPIYDPQFSVYCSVGFAFQIACAGRRGSIALTFASTSPLASAGAWIFVNSTDGSSPQTDDFVATLAGASVSLTVSSTISAQKVLIGSAIDLRGFQTLACQLSGYPDLAAYSPAYNASKNRVVDLTPSLTPALLLAPNWSKP